NYEECRDDIEVFMNLFDEIQQDKKEVMQEEIHDYFEEEDKLTKKLFNLDDILQFCRKHRVEVIMGSDYQYECYIDAKPNDGCYATGLSPLGAMILGIKTYNDNRS